MTGDDRPLRRAEPGPAREVDVSVELVRGLLEDQHPDLAGMDLRIVDEGWDNVILRLGPDLSVRVPRRAIAAPFAANEHKWLPQLAPHLPLPVPVPLRVGGPGRGYPWSWSICPWFPGDRWIDSPPDDLVTAARDLARFLVALHRPAPADAPVNPFRGVALVERHDATVDRITALGDIVDGDWARSAWDAATHLPPWSAAKVWVHGDPHAANLIVRDGRLAAVIDFGDIGAGDPAPDLAVAWVLFDREARRAFRAAFDHDGDTWARARGWALQFALLYLADTNGDAGFLTMGHHAIRALREDEAERA